MDTSPLPLSILAQNHLLGAVLAHAAASSGPLTSILLWGLGFVGLSGVLGVIKSSRRLSRHQRFYRFRRQEDIDMVLPTSDRSRGGAGIGYMRSVTAVGNMTAATEIAQVIGYGSRKRQIHVAVTAELEQRLRGDLVLIGLPVKNPVASEVLKCLNRQNPDLGLRIDERTPEAGGCCLALGEFSGPFEVCVQPGTEIPNRDIALIVMWINPLAVTKRRLIWCAGFTAYGTAAAAGYLVDQFLADRYGRLKRRYKDLASLWRPRKWVCFAMVIETHIVNDQTIRISEVAFVPLHDPGPPPFDVPLLPA